MKHPLIGVVLVALLMIGEINNEPVVYARQEEPQQVQIETEIDWTQERIQQEIRQQAELYKVSAEVMWKVILCESRDPDTGKASTTIQSFHRRPDGSREQSFGLSQIYLPAHPTVTKEQAIDPEFAIDFLARHLAQGKGHLWTCYRMLK